MKINKPLYLLLAILLFPMTGFSQFESDASKEELYDNAHNIRIYIQMALKDKLYLINGQQVKYATKELDFSVAKIDESINIIDLNVEEPKLREQMDRIKELWHKFSLISTQKIDNKEFMKVYYQVNMFDKMVSDLIEKMFVTYHLSSDKFKKYRSIQQLRYLIQKTAFNYYANSLGLSKSVSHEYQKNIERIDTFIKEQSNMLLNDNSKEQSFVRIITDWNFFRANLFHLKMKNVRTIFSLSTSMDYKLKTTKDAYLNSLIQQ
jgi:hypothetical protein